MYRAYLVPDATQYNNRAAMYQAKLLLWDPRSESDAYAIIGPKFKGEINKAESFEFTILPANIHYANFYKKKSVVIIYDDDEWIFEGVVSDCPKDFYKQMKVTCSGPLSYLCDSVQAPDEKNEITIPTASGNIYIQVPKQWYNNADPNGQGWRERSNNVDNEGNYTYTLTTDTTPNTSKTYYYVSSGDNQNHSGSAIIKTAATTEIIKDHLERLLEVHNSQVDAFKNIYLGSCVNDSTPHEFKSSNYRETWSAIKSDIIDEYGRYITIKMDNQYKLKLDYLELIDMDPHTTPETSIVFTENMIEMTESNDNDDDIFTVLIPTGKNNLTVSGLAGHDSPEYNDNRMVDPYVKSFGNNRRYVVVSKYAVKQYGYIVKTETFSDAKTASDLWTTAVKYIKNNFDAHKEYEVKGIDKFILGENSKRITVGKKCRVRSGWHGVDEKDLYVISAEHDLVSPDNDSYRIGIPTSDRESMNKTLTGQTTTSSTKSANSYASAASTIASLTDILDKYVSEHEGWLDLNYKIRNTFESDNGMFITRFEQDESHINLMAQKIFGLQGADGLGDSDAGWILIPKPPYRKSGNGVEDYYESSNSGNTSYKIPSQHNWYEKGNDGKYRLSTQTTRVTQAQVNDPSVNFYIMRLATRYSEIDVGEGGIKARVDGNYLTSTYCSSWITLNEDSILALTGHLYVDNDGHVHVTSGSGMRTDHEESSSTLKYIQVARSSYTANTNPKEKDWYERKLDSSNVWLGQGKVDVETNGAYYTSTKDTTVDRSKYYYYKSYIRETFVSEFGVYDEDNLNAGVMVRVINHPNYRKVPMTELNNHKIKGDSPASLGWYVYDAQKGTYGLTLDTQIGSITDTKYYTVTNNMDSWSYLNGEHIVIGHTDGYSGLNAATQAKVDKYVEDHNLDGTITEIASDVVTVNTLIAKYIDVDEITVNTYLSSENGHFSKLRVGMNADASNIEDGDLIANSGEFDELNGGHTKVTSLTFSPIGSSVGFGFSGGWDLGVTRLADPGDIIMGFGDISTSGDTVTIPFTTLYDYCNATEDTDHVLSFEKPASIGRAVWSSGSGGAHDLKVYTVGGWNEGNSPQWAFYHALVTYPTNYLVGAEDSEGNNRIVYNRNGSNIGAASLSGLSNKPTIKAHIEISGDDYDKNGNSVAFGHDVSDDAPVIAGWSKYIFIDASQAFDDGKSVGKGSISLNGPIKVSNLNPQPDQYEEDTINALTSLSYGVPYSIYLTSDGNVYGTRRFFKTPGKGTIRTYASNGQEAGTINLGYNDSVVIRAQRKMDGDNNWDSAASGITVQSPSVGSVKTYYEYDYDGNGDAEENTLTSNRTLTLNYSDEVPVKGRYQDGLGNWHEGYVLTVKSRSDRLSEGRNGTTISSPVSTTAPSGVTPIDLTSYGTVYEVHKIFDSTNDGGTIYFRTPNDNGGGSGTISTNDIQLVSVNNTTTEPSDCTPLTVLRDTVIAANRAGTNSSPMWVSFTVKVGNLASKKYKMRFPPQQ